MPAAKLKDVFEQYRLLLKEIDSWFSGCLQRHSGRISCRSGCSACCRGLFDITLLDALYLKEGLTGLDPAQADEVCSRSVKCLREASTRHPGFASPWLLNHLPEEQWDLIMPEDDETPCVLLGADGRCLVYEYRPMTCRLNGIPLIDTSGEELFDDWCTLNFTDIDPSTLKDLRHPFNQLFAQELLLFRELIKRLTGQPRNECDTVIPGAVLLDLERIIPILK